MKNKRVVSAIAVSLTAAMVLAACGGGNDDNPGGTSGGAAPVYNAGVDKVVNPSDKAGGTIKFAYSDEVDSPDPGETYYGFNWDLVRLYIRPLMTFKPAPGKESNELVPDLAEAKGVPSDGGKTWTYKIRKGVKYEDGTPVTSKDVKHAVLRSTDKATFPNGPAYFEQFLNLPEGYKGPYKSKGVNTDSAITTPDDQTVVFHLKVPYGGFDYFAQLPQTAPVPEAKDTGAKYRQHVLSTGPYKFEKYEQGKSMVLVRNDQWDRSTDSIRKALPDRWEISFKVNANDIDNRILSGDLHLDFGGTGVQSATLSKVLGDPAIKAKADNPTIPRLHYVSINGNVKPFDNIECRKAIQYGIDRVSYQTAYGGPVAGGDIATTLTPPSLPNHEKFDLYPSGADNKGDLDKAKSHLQACGQPNGFSTKMTFRADRPKEKAAAESVQQSLDRVGIKVELQGFPGGDYFSQFAGNPPFMKKGGFGLAANSWGADWNDGFGFLSQITDSRVIRETGGSSNVSVRSPAVDGLIDEAIAETDTTKREAKWTEVDKKVMEESYIFPGLYAKTLLLRNDNLTNVFYADSWGMYEYLNLGLK